MSNHDRIYGVGAALLPVIVTIDKMVIDIGCWVGSFCDISVDALEPEILVKSARKLPENPKIYILIRYDSNPQA
jgi:hypothetical protein